MSKPINDIYTELIAIAEAELNRISKTIPDDPAICFVMLLEMTRMYDYLHFGPDDELKEYRLSFQQVDVLKSGWNVAISFLFKPITHFTGIPAIESSEETRKSAISMLYQFGCIALLKRTAEMG
ncbi:MAG: hypothetical protein JWP69_2182 [Flaviaesturariibacter sp.]|nr:hypothetical protein [Flaviaesturariibacter sp.]